MTTTAEIKQKLVDSFMWLFSGPTGNYAIEPYSFQGAMNTFPAYNANVLYIPTDLKIYVTASEETSYADALSKSGIEVVPLVGAAQVTRVAHNITGYYDGAIKFGIEGIYTEEDFPMFHRVSSTVSTVRGKFIGWRIVRS